MTNLLLISNSKCLLEKQAGEAIDKFDGLIGRYNLYKIYEDNTDFSPNIGTRTDFWLARSCSDLPNRSPQDFNHLFLFIPEYNLSGIQRQVSRQLIQKYGGEKITVVDTDKTFQTTLKLQLKSHQRPSVGAMSLNYFLFEGYNIWIYGWDYEISHYFKRQPLDSVFHDFEKEQKFINELIEEGSIKIWNPKNA